MMAARYQTAAPPWTTAEKARLVDLYDNAVPVEDIAEALGRTPKAVAKRIYILGLCRRASSGWTTEEDELLTHLYQVDRISIGDIGNTLGRPYTTIRNRCRELGLRRPPITPKKRVGHPAIRLSRHGIKMATEAYYTLLLEGSKPHGLARDWGLSDSDLVRLTEERYGKEEIARLRDRNTRIARGKPWR